LNDYRKRYALYKSQYELQNLHQKVAMIVVWDDHEIANNLYQNKEGFSVRVEDALQAYFEWLPIRPITTKKEIYRHFSFGNLVDLYMLETRLVGRTKPLDYLNYFDDDKTIDSERFLNDLNNSESTMLGETQLLWLQENIKKSKALWQVLGQQVLMAQMYLPSELVTLLSQLTAPAQFNTTQEILFKKVYALSFELNIIKNKTLQGIPLTKEELKKINTLLPYNLEAWDGYKSDREAIFRSIKEGNKNLVVFAGDTHNAWASNLKDENQNSIGVEFATASVSSDGFEEYLGLTSVTTIQLEGVLTQLIENLVYSNARDRGFMKVTFSKKKVVNQWYFVNTTKSQNYNPYTIRDKELTLFEGKNAL